MTATEELRAMLDELGVEWRESANTLGCVFTRWHSPLFGDEVCAMENGEEGLVLFDHFMTPQQAIEATLGRGECNIEYAGLSDDDQWSYDLSCGHSVTLMGRDNPRFCPHCGAKVVD